MLPFNVWAQSLWETLYMVILSTAISYLIGLPLGLTLVVTDKNGIRPMPVLNTVLGIVVNILRSVPFLILAVMITPVTRAIVGKAIGTTAMIVPLTFAAAPYIARMVESSIKEVPFGVIEAAQSMGASPWQIVWKVLVPEAKPSLMVGGAISIVTILGYSAMAGFIGGGGLGTVAVNYGYNRYNFPIMLIAVIIIVVVVQIFQEVGMRLAYTGAVKEDVIDTETLACHFIALLAKYYPQTLSERYKLEAPEGADGYDLLQLAGKKRGYLVSGGEVNTERMAKALMDDYRSGKLGKLTLESPEDMQ